ncbi:hypothetical protein WOLCODRAFT_160971 [Wolfiporia cocos MD-104 SS10]|uniref:F-box domain-containing protein n=1 Tax=Wolfiporia cocos (strain MD-104) TaxID=742152 RepID=A0A2H3JD10_WOLCO|nr:hypothetical protein WOLCODRAFT_160971 [Wolfiporia cocos MD-104 SS10]
MDLARSKGHTAEELNDNAISASAVVNIDRLSLTDASSGTEVSTRDHTLALMPSLQLTGLEDSFISETPALSSRSEKKSALHVNQLPPEILAVVFQLVPGWWEICHPDLGEDSVAELPRTRELIPVTHVCRRWREVALGAPTLWSSVILDCRGCYLQDFEDCIFQRSLMAPLRVLIADCPHDPWENSHYHRFFQTFGHRLEELHLYYCRISMSSWLARLNAPELKTLTLIRDPVDEKEMDVAISFEGDVSSLQHLWLRSTGWIPSIHLPNLTFVCFHDCIGTGVKLDVLSVLSSCPNLVDLALWTSVDLDDDLPRQGANAKKVSLPHLRRLTLKGFVDIADSPILSSIIVPLTASVRLVVSYRPPLRPNTIATLTRLPVWKEATRWYICHSPDALPDAPMLNIAMAGSVSGITLLECVDIVGAPDQFRSLPESTPGLVELVSQAPPVRELWLVDKFIARSERATRALLEMLPAIETIVVFDTDLLSIQDAFKDLPCPHLRHLHILCIGPTASGEDPADNSVQDRVTYILSLLTDAGLHNQLRRLTVGYHPEYSGTRVERTVYDDLFESVIYESYKREPRMEMPAVCTEDVHVLWPGFAYDFDLN